MEKENIPETEQTEEDVNQAKDPQNAASGETPKNCENTPEADGAESVRTGEEDAAKDAEFAGGEKGRKKELRALREENKVLSGENTVLKKEVAEEKYRYARMLAEYENFRRRSAKEREGTYNDACADVLKEMLPVLDNLERATQYAESEKLLEGVGMIITQFRETLSKIGVEAFGETGDAFDPNLHHAIAHEEDAEKPENVVTDVFQKGYKKGDKVIRFAMVKVVN